MAAANAIAGSKRGEDRGSETHESLAQIPAGALKRLSTAVFVDQSRALDVRRFANSPAPTLGYDAGRGDTLAVEAVRLSSRAR